MQFLKKDDKLIFSNIEAKKESSRCLYCYDAPCIEGCPTSIDIPKFISQINTGDIFGATSTILNSNILGYSCAKVCPVEVLCVKKCVLNSSKNPIKIGKLQEYVILNSCKYKNFFSFLNTNYKKNNYKIAIIGSGPSSLAAAGLLSFNGSIVDIYEKDNHLGGLNSLGIVPHKISYSESLMEINWLMNLNINYKIGINIFNNSNYNSEDFLKKYDSVIISIGLGEDKILSIPGAINNIDKIYNSIDLIKKIKLNLFDFNLLSDTRKIHIIGGGNTAIDISILFSMFGNYVVNLYYRKKRDFIPAYSHEILNALKNGVSFFYEHVPIKIVNENGKSFVIYNDILNSENKKESFDLLVIAIGQNKNFSELVSFFKDININKHSLISVNEFNKTSNNKIWATGDCINGGRDVVSAVESSKVVVKNILGN